jgi:hypothetical protein
VNTRINIFQWILTKLGTYLVLRRIWNPIDFQGQRSRSLGNFFTCNILVNTLQSTSPLTLKINTVPDSLKV